MIDSLLEILFPFFMVTSAIAGLVTFSSIELKSLHSYLDKLRAFGWGVYFQKYRDEYIKPERLFIVGFCVKSNLLVFCFILIISMIFLVQNSAGL